MTKPKRRDERPELLLVTLEVAAYGDVEYAIETLASRTNDPFPTLNGGSYGTRSYTVKCLGVREVTRRPTRRTP